MLLNEAELLICKAVRRESSPKKGWIGISTVDPAGNVVIHDIFTKHEMRMEVKKLLDKFGKDLLEEINHREPAEGSKSIFISHEHAEDHEAAKKLAEAFLDAKG
jgi:hypothetical protein